MSLTKTEIRRVKVVRARRESRLLPSLKISRVLS